MERLPLGPDRLSYRSGGYRYVLTFDEDYLIIDCQGSTYSKVTKTPLRDLKAELTTERWIPASAYSRSTEARYLLAAAVVVFFSDVHKYVPLLAPACLVLVAMAFHRAFQASWPLTKTVIRKDDDEFVASVPHIRSLQAQRNAFEEALSQMIKAARNEDGES